MAYFLLTWGRWYSGRTGKSGTTGSIAVVALHLFCCQLGFAGTRADPKLDRLYRVRRPVVPVCVFLWITVGFRGRYKMWSSSSLLPTLCYTLSPLTPKSFIDPDLHF